MSLVHLPIRWKRSPMYHLLVYHGPQIYRLAKATNTHPVSRLKIKLTTHKDYLPTSTTPIYHQKKIKMSPFKRDDFNRKPDHLNQPSFVQSEKNICFSGEFVSTCSPPCKLQTLTWISLLRWLFLKLWSLLLHLSNDLVVNKTIFYEKAGWYHPILMILVST